MGGLSGLKFYFGFIKIMKITGGGLLFIALKKTVTG
jgi:hypothetical protein